MSEPIDVSRLLGQLEAGVKNISESLNRLIDAQEKLREENDQGRSRLYSRIDAHEKDNAREFDDINRAIVDVEHMKDMLEVNAAAIGALERRMLAQEKAEDSRLLKVRQNKLWIRGILGLVSLVEGTKLAKWLLSLVGK